MPQLKGMIKVCIVVLSALASLQCEGQISKSRYFFASAGVRSWTGQVVSLNEKTCEVWLARRYKSKITVFIGKFASCGGTTHSNSLSQKAPITKIRTAERITVFYITDSSLLPGMKFNVPQILHIEANPGLDFAEDNHTRIWEP